LRMLKVKGTAKDRAREMQRTGWIIDPRSSKLMPKWDIVILVALCFTALVTPVEVAFLEEGQYINGLWIVNRLVDLVFICDIIITFNLAYQASIEQGGHWVFHKRVVAYKYLRGWFIIDLVSVVPFWIMTLDYNHPFGGGNERDVSSEARLPVLMRIIKLLRMLKLARMFKASVVLQRLLLDLLVHKWEWTFAVLNMVKLCLVLMLYAHMQACGWGLVSSNMQADGHPNWIMYFDQRFREKFNEEPTWADRYIAALYWSVMTLTSIGYGEMTAENTTERLIGSIWMMLSGVMWTYVIGSVAAIASNLDPSNVEYQNTMDALNYFMRERELPREMRMTLRDYFSSARRVHQTSDDGDLLDKMSPLLQGTVALAANRKWLERVWYLRELTEKPNAGSSDLVAGLAKQLVIRSFIGHERLPVGQLYILRRGLVVKMWRFLGSGKVWGEDIILNSSELIDHSQAVALTYVEAYTLRRDELDEVLDDFPEAKEHVRKAARRVTMQRALLKYLATQQGKPGPSSFAPSSMAKGYVEVPSTAKQGTEHAFKTMDQKVDSLTTEMADLKAQLAQVISLMKHKHAPTM